MKSESVARRSALSSFPIALIAVLACFGFSSGAQAGTIVADSGFRVDPNGFSFPNYANDQGYANLNANEMQRLFGNSVCLVGRGARCVLTPAARNWMTNTNESMGGGHCYGFAMLASLIQRDQISRFGYPSLEPLGGGPNAFDLSITGNRVLQGTIARAFATQTLPSVINQGIYGRPTRMLNVLREKLNPTERETYQVLIFKPGFEEGHAITAYAVEDMGGGVFDLHVYDNNWPGDDTRRLTINSNTDSWSYQAAQNPDQQEYLYQGDAKTQTLMLKPTRPGLGIQNCTFCTGRQGGGSKFTQVSISGSSTETARLLITDARGRRTGYLNGGFVNRIPGARVIHRASNTSDTLEPLYMIPRKTRFKVRINGRRLTEPVRQNLSMVGPTFDATVTDIRIKPGQVAHATLAPGRQRLSFTATTIDTYPEVDFGAQAKRAAYRIGVHALRAPRGTRLIFTKKPRLGLLRIAAAKRNPRLYGISIQREDARGTASFSRAYRLRGPQQAYLAYSPLASPRGVARVIIGDPRNNRIKVLKVTKDN